ncbi:MAG: hypothetical protein ACOY4K_12870 [Pseudomonadota bacterium]
MTALLATPDTFAAPVATTARALMSMTIKIMTDPSGPELARAT